jgi:hypothetical protein
MRLDPLRALHGDRWVMRGEENASLGAGMFGVYAEADRLSIDDTPRSVLPAPWALGYWVDERTFGRGRRLRTQACSDAASYVTVRFRKMQPRT